jgi:basic membrane lipoprotein Med (substrate-binding protein (PBP1-ABC) superfamily)
MLKKIIGAFAMFAMSMCYSMSAHTQVKLKGDPKIAFIYLSPAHDGGWTESLDRGRLKLEKAIGLDIAYTEDVSSDKAETRRIIDLYVKRGYNIIIGTAWDYGEAFAEAAKAYPNVAFLNAAGETKSDNLESFYGRTYQGWYLAGMAAGSVTKTNKIGIIAGFPLSVVNWDINAFQRGVQALNPDAHVIANFVNTWHDTVKEGQVAEAMIEQGADVIATNLSAASVPAATEKAGVRFIGFQNDMSPLAPKGHVASVVFNWETYLIPTIRKIIAGTWSSGGIAFVGMETDMIDVVGLADDLPPDIRTKIGETRAAMKSGKFTPFDGPLYKQNGDEVVPQGVSLDDASIWSMNYFVKGVVGTMPAQ